MADAQLAATVFVTDPDTRQRVELAPGTLPEPRLAALVTNPAAWVDGKLPRLPKVKTEGDSDPSGSGQDGASGDASDTSGDGEPKAAPAARKTAATKRAARKTAATKRAASKPARGREAADQGDSGD